MIKLIKANNGRHLHNIALNESNKQSNIKDNTCANNNYNNNSNHPV